MFRFSAKFLVSLGLTIFLLGLLMLAIELNVVPNPTEQRLSARARLCETIAISSSLFAKQGDIDSMEVYLETIVNRYPEALSAGVRRAHNNTLLAATATHAIQWPKSTDFRQETRVEVPVFDGIGKRWGAVELAFEPISSKGLAGFLSSYATQLLGFVGTLSFVAFYLYLGKMLKVMNAKSVPQRVRTALNTLAGGLIVADANGDIVLANDSVSNWVGTDPNTLMGASVNKLPWKLEPGKELPWAVTFASQLPTTGETMRINSVDGERVLIVNSSPMVGNNGELRGVFIGLEDVTVLEQKEVEHKKLREEAERANSAKSDFLARMSHEIRTPMNAILGFTDVLRRGFDKDATERDEYLGTIHSSGEHLLSLINDILDLSKVEAGRMELETTKCSPHKIILDTIQVLQVKADEKQLALDYVPSDSLPEFIQGDPVRLRQIVTNLVGNAIKFTENGGVQVTAQMTGDKFEFAIVDSGIGIPQEALARIFEPFSQADNSVTRKFGGTGLGLAIAKKFAEAMGGGIRVTSQPGKGTAFIVQIETGSLDQVRRITREEALTAKQVNTDTTLEALLPECRILIVDDGESNRKLLRLFLQRAGAELVEAENGQEAVERVNEGPFDVILMDMQMPVMDGYTAAMTLREQGCVIPIVALTAHAMKQDEEKCLNAGCSHFLPKPVNSNNLLQLVSDICGGQTVAIDREASLRAQNDSVPYDQIASAPVVEAPPLAAPVAPSPASSQPKAPTQNLTAVMQQDDELAQTQLIDTTPIHSHLPMDDEDFRQIVIEFVERLGEQLNEMESAANSADFESLAQLAHWLKGSGGTAGFGEFTEPARQLEELAKAQRVESLAPSIAGLRALTNRISIPNHTLSAV